MPDFRLAAEAAMSQNDTDAAIEILSGGATPRIERCQGHDGTEPGWRILRWDELRDALERDIVKAKTLMRVKKLRAGQKEARAKVKQTAANFVPPTVEEVRARLAERRISEEVVDAEAFVASYAQVGWVTKNRVPITDWNDAITTWVRQHAKRTREAGLPPVAAIAAPSKEDEFKRTHGGFSPREFLLLPVEQRRAALIERKP